MPQTRVATGFARCHLRFAPELWCPQLGPDLGTENCALQCKKYSNCESVPHSGLRQKAAEFGFVLVVLPLESSTSVPRNYPDDPLTQLTNRGCIPDGNGRLVGMITHAHPSGFAAPVTIRWTGPAERALGTTRQRERAPAGATWMTGDDVGSP